MVGSDLVCAAALLALTVLVATDTLHLWMLFAAAATIGVAELVFGTSTYALLPTLVPTPELTRANGYLSVAGETGSGVIGPALGGIAFGAAPFIPFAVNTATYLVSSATVGSFARRSDTRAPAPERTTGPKYLSLRKDTEELLRERFIARGGRPTRRSPHYFVLGESPWFRGLYAQVAEVL